MFADDPQNNERHLEVLAGSIRRAGVRDLALCLFGVALAMLPLAYLISEVTRSGWRGFNIGTLILVAIGGVAGWFGVKGLKSSVTQLFRARETDVYRAVAGDGSQVFSFWGVKGARHAIKLSLVGGSSYDLPIASADLEPMITFLRMRCPNARSLGDFAGPRR